MAPARSPDEVSTRMDDSSDPFQEILVPGALEFVAQLARTFAPRIRGLLAEREVRYRAWRGGESLRFRDDTAAVRNGDWRILPIPADLTRGRERVRVGFRPAGKDGSIGAIFDVRVLTPGPR